MQDETDYKEALDRFHTIEEKEKDQRTAAISDMTFVNKEDGQWDDNAINKRRDRPRYTINRIAGAIDQLVGDQRQNRTSIKVSPQTDGDEKTAEIFTGLIRSIEQNSNASNSYDSAYDEQVTGGHGGWRILTEFENDDSFDQEIKIRPIVSAASSLYFDDEAEEYDKRDARFAFLVSFISKKEFQEKYPDASTSDFSSTNYQTEALNGWFRKDDIRIAEYWYKKPIKKRIALLSDDRVIDMDEEKAVLDEIAAMGTTIVRERVADSHRVEMVIMNGAEILTEPKEWVGKYIPLIPVYGKVTTIENETFIRGLTRFSKDPQRIYNYATSSAIESTALTPKDPFWATPKQAAGHSKSWTQFNVKNQPWLLYNADPLSPGPPVRGGAPQLQQALLQQIQQAATDIHATTGLEPASMGNSPELKSGKAIEAQQAMGDRGAYIFQDNLQKSISYTGLQLVDMIPRIYDTDRIVRVLKLDGSTEAISVNQRMVNEINDPIIDSQTGEQVIVNDLAQGKYSVSVSSGPAFATKRKESVDQLIAMMQADPELGPLIRDLIIKNSDVLDGDEAYKRVRHMQIKNGIVKPTEEETKELGLDQPQKPDPAQEALVRNLDAQSENEQASAIEKISKIEMNDAKTEQIIAETMATATKSMSDMLESFIKKQEAGLLITDQDQDLLDNQATVTEIAQEEYIQETAALNDMQIEKEREEEQAEMMQQQQAQQIPQEGPPQGGPPQGPPQPT